MGGSGKAKSLQNHWFTFVLMILSVCETTLNNCLKSDPQFIKHRCEIDARKRNGKCGKWSQKNSKTGPEIDSQSEECWKKDAEIEI